MNRLILWFAQGLGAGRVPFAPGTFGSVVGLFWFWLLLSISSGAFFVAGLLLGIAASVNICGRAEKILAQKDPSSVVLDEIVAVPLCFASWITMHCLTFGQWPSSDRFFSLESLPWTVGVFVAFRVFDIAKPWPVRHSQRLPGGWGIVADDLLAAAYVNLCSLMIGPR